MCVRRTCVCIVLSCLFFVVGCERSAPPELSRPVVVIGVDSADWTWIGPHMDAGRMPNVKGLVEHGVSGKLRSLEPLDKSPTIWTTIATGKRPVEHGVVGFIDTKEHLAGSDMRTAVTYWEILGHLGWRQAVLGWWVTHPAPRLEGLLVSDFLPYFDVRALQGEDAVYPPEVWRDLAPLIVRPEDVDDATLGRFVDVDLWRAHGEEADRLLDDLRGFVAGDLTYLAMARAVHESEPFDVFTVYFRGLDIVSHKYWKWFEPHYSNLADDDWRVRMLRDVVPEYHAFTDELVGEVLSFVHPEARIVFVSDHGFLGHRRGRRGLTVGVKMHRVDGVIAFKGPGFASGTTIEGARVHDVMPTLLAMMDVPQADDLDGRILFDAFEPGVRGWVERRAEVTVPTYEGVVPRAGRALDVDSATNEAVREQLRSLGYIE